MRIFILTCLILIEYTRECIAERAGNADVNFNDKLKHHAEEKMRVQMARLHKI